jgi:acyl-CoA thioester hydrolase
MDGVIEPVMVHFEDLDAMGVVRGGRFRVLSADEAVTHADGRRVQVRLDPATLRPAAIGAELRAASRPLQRATADGLDVRAG